MRSLIAISLSALSLMSLPGCERWELDRQMEELCKKEGGVKVYETVTLPPEMFDQNGYPFPSQMRSAKTSVAGVAVFSSEEMLGTEYRMISKTTYLKNGDPLKGEGVLRRFSEKVVRQADNKILGEAVSFGRSGGDFIAAVHPSSNHCPNGQGSNAATRAVFIKGGN